MISATESQRFDLLKSFSVFSVTVPPPALTVADVKSTQLSFYCYGHGKASLFVIRHRSSRLSMYSASPDIVRSVFIRLYLHQCFPLPQLVRAA